MKRIVIACVSGLLFGLGLAVSGMTDPDKVLNFLDVAGHWDPSLALVMGAALVVSAPAFALMRQRGRSFNGASLPDPPSPRIDARLLAGSALFGIGWGIAGYCPGPALANLAHGTLEAVVFVVALLAGSALCRQLVPVR
ncbi:MAG TPA: YeeE/YedE family protein [Pseudoxanthomonas sp.]|nr:YeeE/YedE family protein [Pseudoxanthomonas sp.]